MGRRRTKNKHLPPRMVAKHGGFYHVRTDGVTASGKPRKVWTLLSRDYSEALRRWADLEGRTVSAPATITELLTRYIAANADRLAPETVRGYRNSVTRLAQVFGHMRPEDLRREHVYRYVSESRKVAANRDRALLGAAYTHAINLGQAQGPNPAHGLRYRAPEKPGDRYVTDAELARLEAAAAPSFALLMRFAYLTGIREGDLCRLTLNAATADGIAWRAGKTGKPQLVAWSDELRATWRQIADTRIGNQPTFRSQRGGGAYTTDGLRATFARVRERAGLRDVTFHDLRRKAGSDVDAAHATELLQHSDPKVTRRHYRAKVVPVKPAR
jgi:integrase